MKAALNQLETAIVPARMNGAGKLALETPLYKSSRTSVNGDRGTTDEGASDGHELYFHHFSQVQPGAMISIPVSFWRTQTIELMQDEECEGANIHSSRRECPNLGITVNMYKRPRGACFQDRS